MCSPVNALVVTPTYIGADTNIQNYNYSSNYSTDITTEDYSSFPSYASGVGTPNVVFEGSKTDEIGWKTVSVAFNSIHIVGSFVRTGCSSSSTFVFAFYDPSNNLVSYKSYILAGGTTTSIDDYIFFNFKKGSRYDFKYSFSDSNKTGSTLDVSFKAKPNVAGDNIITFLARSKIKTSDITDTTLPYANIRTDDTFTIMSNMTDFSSSSLPLVVPEVIGDTSKVVECYLTSTPTLPANYDFSTSKKVEGTSNVAVLKTYSSSTTVSKAYNQFNFKGYFAIPVTSSFLTSSDYLYLYCLYSIPSSESSLFFGSYTSTKPSALLYTSSTSVVFDTLVDSSGSGGSNGEKVPTWGDITDINSCGDTTDLSTLFCNINYSFTHFFKSLFSSLMSGLKALFIPSSDYISSWLDEMKTTMSAKMGVLYLPFDLLDKLNTNVQTISNSSDYILNLPELRDPIYNQVLISAQSIPLGYYMTYGPFSGIHDFYLLCVDVYLIYSLAMFGYRKFNSVFGGGGDSQ